MFLIVFLYFYYTNITNIAIFLKFLSEAALKGLRSRFKIKTSFIVDSQVKKHDSLNIDRFIQRKKLAENLQNTKNPIKTFLFVDAECFLKEKSGSSHLNYVFLDVEKVKIIEFSQEIYKKCLEFNRNRIN